MRTWGCATWKSFSQKVTGGQITEQKCYAFNAFLWVNFLCIFPSSSSTAIKFQLWFYSLKFKSHLQIKIKIFSRKISFYGLEAIYVFVFHTFYFKSINNSLLLQYFSIGKALTGICYAKRFSPARQRIWKISEK
jgi:hypothetical protein